MIWQAGFKMSRPSSGHDERGVNQNEDPGGHRSVFTNTRSAAAAAAATATPETRLLSAFKKDTQARKVQLAGRGESVHLPILMAAFNLLFSSKVAPEKPFGMHMFILILSSVFVIRRLSVIKQNKNLWHQNTSCVGGVAFTDHRPCRHLALQVSLKSEIRQVMQH